MMLGANYVTYGCSGSIEPHTGENIIAVITQHRMIDDSLKRQIKDRISCTIRLFLLI